MVSFETSICLAMLFQTSKTSRHCPALSELPERIFNASEASTAATIATAGPRTPACRQVWPSQAGGESSRHRRQGVLPGIMAITCDSVPRTPANTHGFDFFIAQSLRMNLAGKLSVPSIIKSTLSVSRSAVSRSIRAKTVSISQLLLISRR